MEIDVSKSFVLFCAIFVVFLASGFGNYVERFHAARSLQDAREMERLIVELEREVSNGNHSLRVLLAESYLEYGSWASVGDSRVYLEKAYHLAKEASRADSKDGKAYYVAAVATSRLIDFVSAFEKLSLLKRFDEDMNKVLELMEDGLYKGLAHMGMALRYTNPPWPFNDYKKAEKHFKEAEKYISDYSGLYLNFGVFYLKVGNKTKAREMFEKVLSMPSHPLFKKAHEENVAEALEYLKRLK